MGLLQIPRFAPRPPEAIPPDVSAISDRRPSSARSDHSLWETGAAPPVSNRSNNFNLLRLGLATLVLLSHSPELIDGDRHREILTRIFGTFSFGEVAVDGFFLLSGFLILQSWQNKPMLGGFLNKRILRIYPGFIVASLVSGLVVGPLGADPARYFAGLNWRSLITSMLKLWIPAVPPVFQGQPYPLVNGALWTIAYEFRCYLLVALLGVCGLAGRRWVWPLLATAALVSLVWFDPAAYDHYLSLRVRLYTGDLGPTARFIAFFCTGGAFYSFRDRIRYDGRWALLVAAVLVGCLFRSDTGQVALTVLGAYLLFWFVFTHFPALDRYQTYPDVSYGVYLYGWPTQKLLLWYIPTLSPWVLFPLTVAICLGAGWLSWTFVERPFLRLKRATGSVRPPQPVPARAVPLPDSA